MMKRQILSYLLLLVIIVGGREILFSAESSDNNINKPNAVAFPLDSTLENYNLIYPNISDMLSSYEKGPISIELRGQSRNLTLEKNHLWRGKLNTIVNDGIIETRVELPEPITLKGTVDGYAGSQVRLTISPDTAWMSGYVAFDDNWFIIEPRQKTKLPDGTTEHYLYTRENAGEMYGVCGVADDDNNVPYSESNEIIIERSYSTLKIYGQGDYEFYTLDPDDWATRMISVFNDVEGIYENAINVEFEITGLSVFTSSFEPFTTTDAYGLINAFADGFHGVNSPSRHIMHIFTGKILDDHKIGLTLGYASAGRCGGYTMAQQVREAGYFATAYHKMILSAHEIGHCFDARHNLSEIDSTSSPTCPYMFTIMRSPFEGNCQHDYFSDANIGVMEIYDDYLDDAIGPEASISINSGASYTNSQEVIIDIEAVDNFPHNYHARRMPISFRNSSEEFALEDCFYAPVDSFLPWSLADGDGEKIVEVYCFDISENLTIVSDSIILDQTPPSNVTNLYSSSHNIDEYSTDRSIDICWESAMDSTSGISGYSYVWVNTPEIDPDSLISVDNATFCITSPELYDSTWYFMIRAEDSAGNQGDFSSLGPFYIGNPTDISEFDPALLPNQYAFSQNFPNPFNPSTTFSFSLPKRAHVTLDIYDILGRKITTVIDKFTSAGNHEIIWDGKDHNDHEIASGIYFARFQAADFTTTRKIIMVK